MKNMTVVEFRKRVKNMTVAEIEAISRQKQRNGCATSAALMAQDILWRRDGSGFMSSAHWKRDNTIVKKF